MGALDWKGARDLDSSGPRIYEIPWAKFANQFSGDGRFYLRARQSRFGLKGQAPSAYKSGQYVCVNLLCTPVKNAIVGGEFQWARRENFSDGFTVSGVRLQVTFTYSVSAKLGECDAESLLLLYFLVAVLAIPVDCRSVFGFVFVVMATHTAR